MNGYEEMIDYGNNPFLDYDTFQVTSRPPRRLFNLEDDSVLQIYQDIRRHKRRCQRRMWEISEAHGTNNAQYQRYMDRLTRLYDLEAHYIYN